MACRAGQEARLWVLPSSLEKVRLYVLTYLQIQALVGVSHSTAAAKPGVRAHHIQALSCSLSAIDVYQTCCQVSHSL